MASMPIAYQPDSRAAAPVSQNFLEKIALLWNLTSDNGQLRRKHLLALI
jgi:hypothetical protein